MKKMIAFIIRVVRASDENDLLSLAGELTYCLILAFFPFLIFLMALVGFFNLSASDFLEGFGRAMPDAIHDFLLLFAKEVIDVKNYGVLSASLFVSLFSASSGLLAVMRGVNKAYGQKETRHFVKARLISIGLVIVLASCLILSITTIVFVDLIYRLIAGYITVAPAARYLFGIAVYIVTRLIFLAAIITIYRVANSQKVSLRGVLPGALVTFFVWIAASKLFNLYMNHFAQYATIYGSIAGVFILMYWLYILSVVLLLGGEINAALGRRE